MTLTPKQERFAQEIASGKSQSDAYRAAFNVHANTKADTIHKRASELIKSGQVAGRVEELRKPIIEEVGITLKTHLEDLKRLRNAAVQNNQYGAAISAEVARGKAAGIHVEKSEVVSITKSLTPLNDEDWI
jgi:phage terminase small subunit